MWPLVIESRCVNHPSPCVDAMQLLADARASQAGCACIHGANAIDAIVISRAPVARNFALLNGSHTWCSGRGEHMQIVERHGRSHARHSCRSIRAVPCRAATKHNFNTGYGDVSNHGGHGIVKAAQTVTHAQGAVLTKATQIESCYVAALGAIIAPQSAQNQVGILREAQIADVARHAGRTGLREIFLNYGGHEGIPSTGSVKDAKACHPYLFQFTIFANLSLDQKQGEE